MQGAPPRAGETLHGIFGGIPVIRIASLICAVAFTSPLMAQDKKTAPMIFNDARDLITAGNYEVAGDLLVEFLKAAPTDQDYLDLEAKYGPTTFLKLRTVPRWYDDPKRNTEFKKDVLEKIVAASIKANETMLKNPRRIRQFIHGLNGINEEYTFALQELKRSGDYVVPLLVEELRLYAPTERGGIYRAIPELGPETIPGLLAAAQGMKDEFRLPLLNAILKRPDFNVLATFADTNAIPFLWYLSLDPLKPNQLRDLAVAKLSELYGASFARRSAEEELTRAAIPLYERKAKFQAGDAATKRATLWMFNPKTEQFITADVPQSQAEETIGLQYLRWAVDRNAKYEPALDLFLSFATERAVERAGFRNLAEADPNAFRLLADAPTTTLIRLLENAITGDRTALALGLTQALGDRAEPAAANVTERPGGGSRTPVLVKALNFKDPRVQLAAALALVRIPNARHGAEARIVEVLARAISPDPASARGKALIADPSLVRGDQIANLLRAVGYQVEVFGNGKLLANHIDRASDFDLVLVDRHIVSPSLTDLIPQLRADPNLGQRPLFIVASSDARHQLGLETLLAKMAALIAATETQPIEVPGLPAVDRRKSLDEIERDRKAIVELRDKRVRELYDLRLARLQRLLDSANIRKSDLLKRRLDLRLPQLTMAALIAEYDLTPTSAPKLVRDYEQLTSLIKKQQDLDESVKNVNTTAFVKLVLQLETVLTPELQKKFALIRARLDADTLGLAEDEAVDPATEAALRRLARAYGGVSVIREPYSLVGFESDVLAAMPQPEKLPRKPDEKAAASKAAVEALLKLSTGAYAGYDITPAVDALRNALKNDDLVIAAAEALSRVSNAAAQSDLIRVATDGKRSATIRSHAAMCAVRSIQAYGKLANAEVVGLAANATGEGTLGSDLAVLRTLLAGQTGDFAKAVKSYVPTIAPPPKPKTDEKKPDEKKDESKPDEKKDESKPDAKKDDGKP